MLEHLVDAAAPAGPWCWATVRISRPVRPACWAEASRQDAHLEAGVRQVGEAAAADLGGAGGGRVRSTMIRIVVDLPAPLGRGSR